MKWLTNKGERYILHRQTEKILARNSPGFNSKYAKIIQEAQKNQQNYWKNQDPLDIDNIVSLFEDKTKSLREPLVKEAVSNLAIIEGVQAANTALQAGLNMQETAIELPPVVTLAKKIFRIKLAEIITEQVGFPDFVSKEIIYRIMTQEFPVGDLKNVATPKIKMD